ncbi:MAG: primosomal protein N' [Treponema sp.]|nr:primosomal protein N' [Treponema sp.]
MKRYLQIVLNVPLNQAFTYLDISSDEESSGQSHVGYRADIKFGNRRTTGFIIAESSEFPADCGVEESKIRPILRLLDKEPVFTPELIALARWLSSFYLCSVGEAISAMLPGGKRETDAGSFSFTEEAPDTTARTLSEEQASAVDGILSSAAPSRLHYLYGPTGTGKTEVFLQAAERLLSQGRGVIYLVPEIGLTKQVIEAVIARFGQTAAVLHSGLTPSQRLGEWKRILHKEARVVIGARSAVFAPVPDLGMIIIDEEHDASYKSGSTPRYHARQVAMYRSAKLNIPLVMGSATPSAEAWYAMKTDRIIRHSLTRRLAGGAMPQIKAINLSALKMDGCISTELAAAIKETLSQKRQTILFLNRRGFTHFFRCNTCGFEMKCKNCSVALTYHKNEKRLRCHYCGWSTVPPQECPECGSLDVGYSGFGTEFIEQEVRAKFPAARITRVDTDNVTHKGELQEKLDAFRRGEYDIMLGTQMVAKGLNFPNLQLVGVILADTGLHLPDFRAAERTFALITQVAGRAGRFFPDGRVLVQTYAPDRKPIVCAVQGEIAQFYEDELKEREMLDFPPFSRLVRLVFRAPTERQAEEGALGAAEILRSSLKKIALSGSAHAKTAEETEILGPAECPIAKIAMNWRYQILLRGNNLGIMQSVTADLLYNYKHSSDVYIECDVDPVSLL